MDYLLTISPLITAFANVVQLIFKFLEKIDGGKK